MNQAELLRYAVDVLEGQKLIDRAYVEQWARQLGFMEEWQAVLDRLSGK